MKSLKQRLINIFKGIGVGASMLLPGVSGGTMAIMLNIYDELIYAVGSFMKEKRKNFVFLGTFSLGGLLGVFLFSKPILYLTTTFKMPMMFLFMGAIIASFPTLFKKANIKKIQPYHLLYPLIGILIVLVIALLPKDLFAVQSHESIFGFLLLIFAGVLCAIALVLPGISLSYVLLLFGMYESTMTAIQQLNIMYLLPIALGGVIGTIATTKVLENAMEKHSQATYLIIIGFLVSSIFDVFPGVPQGIEWIICPIFFCIGYMLIFLVSKVTKQ